ncbi:MAG: cation transporter, partial [Desulfobacterales bacterium]|nr:cation transporter [Desulfobacterales bacterium]
ILISIFLGKNLWWIDGVFGIIVSLVIVYTAIDIMKEAAQPILGEIPKPDNIEKITKIGERFNLNDIHHIHEHSYGSHLEYTMHVYMPKDSPIFKAYSITKKFREVLRKELNIESTVYIKPK